MRKPSSRWSPGVLAGLAFSVAAASATAADLTSQMALFVVEADATGAELLVERNRVRPGEVLQYVLQHRNMTDAGMEGLVIEAPVPEGVTIAFGKDATSVPAVFEVQADLDPEREGLEWSELPAVRKVLNDDGSWREEPLPEELVAAVRWTFAEPLEAGAAAVNSYRVRVD